MHKRSCFWNPFGSERVNESLKLPKSSKKYFHPSFSSFLDKLSWKKLFLVRSEILGLLFKTYTANYKYSRRSTDNLPLPVEMQLSGKLKAVSGFFYRISSVWIKLWNFRKEDQPPISSIYEVIDSQTRTYLNA